MLIYFNINFECVHLSLLIVIILRLSFMKKDQRDNEEIAKIIVHSLSSQERDQVITYKKKNNPRAQK